MTERVLSERALNRALLARQLLLERADLTPATAVGRLGGLQTQYAPSAYIGLWSRLHAFGREDLTRALERRAIVQATLMRTTIHMVPRADYWPIAKAVRDARRTWWLRAFRAGIDARTMAAKAAKLRRLLRDGPRTRAELQKGLGDDAGLWIGLGLWVDLVRVPPSGTWERRRADLFGLAEAWLGPPPPDRAEGVELLIRRYLGGFGPAAPSDIANWAGLPTATLAAALERMRLRRFRDERGQGLVDLPRAPLPDPDTPAPIRFLPTFDATLLAHARRTQILPERFRPRVFDTKTPHSSPTFLVDGRVAGTWRHDGERVLTEPFEPLSQRRRRQLAAEAERLAALHA